MKAVYSAVPSHQKHVDLLLPYRADDASGDIPAVPQGCCDGKVGCQVEHRFDNALPSLGHVLSGVAQRNLIRHADHMEELHPRPLGPAELDGIPHQLEGVVGVRQGHHDPVLISPRCALLFQNLDFGL